MGIVAPHQKFLPVAEDNIGAVEKITSRGD